MHVFCRSSLVWLMKERIYPLLRRVMEHAESNPESPPPFSSSTSDSWPCTLIDFPKLGWVSLHDAHLKCPTFTVSTMVGYFVKRKDEDRLPSENCKALFGGENKVFHLLKWGTFRTLSWQYMQGMFFFSPVCS